MSKKPHKKFNRAMSSRRRAQNQAKYGPAALAPRINAILSNPNFLVDAHSWTADIAFLQVAWNIGMQIVGPGFPGFTPLCENILSAWRRGLLVVPPGYPHSLETTIAA